VLRQIGKRNAFVHGHAIQTANNILAQNNKKANWVALHALRELSSDAVLAKVNPFLSDAWRSPPNAPRPSLLTLHQCTASNTVLTLYHK